MTECIQVGQQVPDFSLTTFDPKTNDFGSFNLAENGKAGRWSLFFFYPADFTFVCATEFSALADLHDQFDQLGCDIVTVSTDTQFTHLAWHREEGQLANVKYLMGADTTGAVAKMFGCYLDDAGLALRGTYLVAPDGKLMNSLVNFLNMGRNINELLRMLKANLYLASATGEACPSKWQDDGDKTLTPSAAMVGKVDEAING